MRATPLAIGQVCLGAHPHTGGGGTLPNGGWAPGCPLAGWGHMTTFNLPFLVLSAPCGECILCPPTLQSSPMGLWCVYRVYIPSRGMGATWGDGGGWCGSGVIGEDCSRSCGLGHLCLLAHLLQHVPGYNRGGGGGAAVGI